MATLFSFLRVRKADAALLVIAAGTAFCQQPQQPHGVPARATPGDYPSHLMVDGVSYAAALVSSDEVKHTFAFDITKMYVVFEVAVYPNAGSQMTLSPDGFVVHPAKSLAVVHRADSVTVASVIQQKNLPKPPSAAPPVVASTEVGYESGRDPYTGQRVNGVYTASQVGVGMGRDDAPPRYPSPGGYPQDREVLEQQLWEKSLPEGNVQRPTAGYLYFPASLLKKKSGDTYQVEYLGSQDADAPQLSAPNAKVALNVPAKNR